MRQQLEESKNDLNIITSYLKKKENKDINVVKRPILLNISKKSCPIDKSTSGDKNSFDSMHNSFNP